MAERSRTRSVLAVSTVVAPGVAAVFGALTGWAMQTTPVAAPVQVSAQASQGASNQAGALSAGSLSSGMVKSPLAKARAAAEATHRDVSSLQRQLASLRAQLSSVQRQTAGRGTGSSDAAAAPVQQFIAQPAQQAQPVQQIQQQPVAQPAPAAPPPVQTTTGGSTVKH